MDPTYKNLFTRSLIALVVGVAGVVVCYFWIDRPVAFYVHDHEINKIALFRWLTLPPPWVQTWSPLALVVLAIRRIWGPLTHCEVTLFASLLSLIVANEFRVSVGDLSGRYWPETWFNNNSSLIGNGTYGFHPFAHGDDIGSFPSGHTARIIGFAGVWWIAVPRSRVLVALVCPPLTLALVAMNYHFVGDVVAGGVLGGIMSAYAAAIARRA